MVNRRVLLTSYKRLAAQLADISLVKINEVHRKGAIDKVLSEKLTNNTGLVGISNRLEAMFGNFVVIERAQVMA